MKGKLDNMLIMTSLHIRNLDNFGYLFSEKNVMIAL